MDATAQKLTPLKALSQYFGSVKPLSGAEIRDLTSEERKELAQMAAKELKVELVVV